MKTHMLILSLVSLLLSSGLLHAEDRSAYVAELATLTLPQLAARGTGAALAGVTACGVDTVEVAVVAVADTLPLVSLFVLMAGHTFDYGNYASRLTAVAERRGVSKEWRGDHLGYLDVLLGGPLGILTIGAVESLSNVYKAVAQERPQGLDYSSTRVVTASAYILTEEQFMASFSDKSSACRRWLWKLYQVAGENAHRMRVAGLASNEAPSRALRPADDVAGAKQVFAAPVAQPQPQPQSQSQPAA